MAYWCTLASHQHIQFHWWCIHLVMPSHLLKSSKFPLTICLQFVTKCSSLTKRALFPPHHSHQPMLAMNWCCIICDFTSFDAPYFIAWLEISSLVFLFKHTTQLLVLFLGNRHAWFHWYIFGCLHVTSSPYVVHFQTFAPWNHELSYIVVIHSWLISISLTLWCQMLYLCNAHCGTLNCQMSYKYMCFYATTI
jgi:hypothetical protein